MKKISFLLIVCISSVWWSCGGVPPTFYYRIDYTLPATDDTGHAIPVTLGIGRFDATSLYEGDRIVYRKSRYEVNYYNYRRWVAAPQKIVTEKIYSHIKKSGLFKDVVRLPSSMQPDYVLAGQLQAFEEWDEGESWFGLVTIEFTLKATASGIIIWDKTFSEKTKSLAKKPVDVVQAISHSLQVVTVSAVNEISKVLRKSGH